MGDSESHLPRRDKESWRGVKVDERLQFIEDEMFVMYPELTRLLKEIKRRYMRAKKRGHSMALLVIISSGGGKTNLVRLLKHLMPDVRLPTQLVRPVVALSIPDRPSPAAMSRELLKATGDAGWNTGKDDDALDRAIDILKRIQANVVAIDNVQDIPERRGEKGVNLVGNWVRDLRDDGACLILLLGTPAALQVIEANPQLRRRNPARIDIPYFSIETAGAFACFKRFLHEVDKQLPLAELSGLKELTRQFYWATRGIADYIFQLLSESIEVAVEDGRETIARSDLVEAFDRLFLDSAQSNPFAEDGPQRVLDKKGEPFHDWHGVPSRQRRGAESQSEEIRSSAVGSTGGQ